MAEKTKDCTGNECKILDIKKLTKQQVKKN